MTKRRQYRNPPIEEALCEFQFESSQDWDLTMPGRLQTELKGEYSSGSREIRTVTVGYEVQNQQPANFQFEEKLAKVMLASPNRTRLVGVGPDLLSVHMLRPYQGKAQPNSGGWEEFKRRIQEALETYWNVTNPIGVNRVGLRYINMLKIPHSGVVLEDYFKCILPETDGLPDEVGSFLNRTEYVYPNGARLNLTQGSLNPTSPNQCEFLLDLELFLEQDDPLNFVDTLTTVEDLRGSEREAFESLITEKARRLFDDA